MTDMYLSTEQAAALRAMTRNPPNGLELVDEWKRGPVNFYRVTLLVDADNMATVWRTFTETRKQCIGDVPVAAQVAIRDVRFDVNDVLPYRLRPYPRRKKK